MPGSIIMSGARTPIGKLSGALAGFSGTDLGAIAIKEALVRAGVDPEQVDYVFMGQVLLAGAGQMEEQENVFDNLSDLNIASRAEIVILRMTTLIAEIEIAKNNMRLPLNNKLLEARAISARILVDKLEVYSADITETARRQVQTALPAGNQ